MDKPRKTYTVLLLMLGLVVISMLYFGFRLKGYRPTNNVRWSDAGPGITFDRYGIAYTEPIVWSSPGGKDAFSLEIALQPGTLRGGFYFVFLAHSGDDARQLLIGQWKSSFVAMHGDDYDNRRKSPKVAVDIGHGGKEPVLLSLVSEPRGTQLYLNGVLKKENPALHLRWPDGGTGAHLILGNSIYGHNFWRGAVTGVALYGHVLTREQVDRNYRAWRERGDFSFAQPYVTEALYLLDEGGGDIAYDRSGYGRHLMVPATMRILKKEVLMPLWRTGRLQWYYDKDTYVNFFGFWPLGFLAAAALALSRRFTKYYIPGALAAAFLFSLSIELGQSWIPSRISSLLDLILNTAGAAFGILLFAMMRKSIVRMFFEDRSI
jgi:hypothetical protein